MKTRYVYTSQKFNLIRLLLISRPCANIHYDRYTSGFYFTWFFSKDLIAVFYEQIDGKQTKIYHYQDLYFSKKDFNFLVSRLT